MDTPENLKTQLTQSQPIPFAATIWEDQPELFEQLRRRLASFAPNTQRALASDWKVRRTWCLENAGIEFPASPTDISEFALAHSPPLYTDQTGAVTMDPEATGPLIRRATTVQRWLASLATLHWKDVQAALAALGDSPRDLRAKAMISVAYSTMARRAELVGIRVEDISPGLDSASPDCDCGARCLTGDERSYLRPTSRLQWRSDESEIPLCLKPPFASAPLFRLRR